MSGFKVDCFKVKPSDKYKCFICAGILNGPRQCPNGHCFCESCILQSLEEKKECPQCHTHLNAKKLSKNLLVQGVIEEMETFCISCDTVDDKSNVDCCPWHGQLKEREEHYETCGFSLVSCSNELCEEKVPKNSLDKHLASCAFRIDDCDHCKNLFFCKDMQVHKQTCQDRRMYCNNECGTLLSFSNMMSHLLNDCPLQHVDCSLHKLGLCQDCTGTVARKDLEEHASRPCSMGNSILFLAAQCVTVRESLLSQAAAVQVLSDENQKLDRKVSDLVTSNTDLTAQVKACEGKLEAAQLSVLAAAEKEKVMVSSVAVGGNANKRSASAMLASPTPTAATTKKDAKKLKLSAACTTTTATTPTLLATSQAMCGSPKAGTPLDVRRLSFLVSDAEVPDANGIYRFAGLKTDSSAYYERKGEKIVGKSRVWYSLHKCTVESGKVYWFLSISPRFSTPGSEQDKDLYYSQASQTDKRPYFQWRRVDSKGDGRKGSGGTPTVVCVRG